MLVLTCRKCSHSYEVGPSEPVESIKCPACGEPLRGPGTLVAPRRGRGPVWPAAAGVLALLAVGGWLAYEWGPGRPDPVKAEARIRARVAKAGGRVLHFWHTPRDQAVVYHVVVGKEGHRLSAFAWSMSSGTTVHDPVEVWAGEVTVEVRCGGGVPVVVRAYREGEGEQVTLSKEQEETCKRLASQLLVALQEALK
jgi:hypothetical protein